MAKPKQLLPIKALDEAVRLAKLGVPLTKIHVQLDLDWSYQSTADLINADIEKKFDATRPSWLPSEGNLLVKAPSEWKYEGVFPNGEWIKLAPISEDITLSEVK